MDVKGKTLQELDLCRRNITMHDKLKELALLLKMDLDVLWEEGYETGSTEGESKLWTAFFADGQVEVALETLMRIMVLTRQGLFGREQIGELLVQVGKISEEQAEIAIGLLEDDAFFEGYDIEDDTFARTARKDEEEKQKHRQFLYQVVAEHISSIKTRGDLEMRSNDGDNLVELSVRELCAALDAVYKAGQESWRD